jgi:hypothetical protein
VGNGNLILKSSRNAGDVRKLSIVVKNVRVRLGVRDIDFGGVRRKKRILMPWVLVMEILLGRLLGQWVLLDMRVIICKCRQQ